MTEAAAELPPARGEAPARGSALTLAALSFALWAGLFLSVAGARNAYETQRELRLIPWLAYDQRVDFAYFYAAASMVWQGDGAFLYPERGEYLFYPLDPVFIVTDDEYVRARLLARGNYYNPPAVAYMQAPLAALPFRTAFWTFSVLSALALGALMVLAWRAGRGLPEMPLVLLGVVAFGPVHEAIIMGHLSLFLTFSLGAGFLALRARQPVAAGLALSLLALKPQWAVLPALFLLVRGDWRALTAMTLSGAALFFLPFLATGTGAFVDYVRFLQDSAAIDVKYAPHMFSWNGFLSKMVTDDPLKGPIPSPSSTVVYALQAVTLAVMLVVWRGRDLYLGAAATIVAMLLVSTRSVWYDWAFLAAAAVLLVLRPSRPAVRIQAWVVLLAIFAAAEHSLATLFAPDGRYDIGHWLTPGLFTLTPVAFAALLWMAVVTVGETGFRVPLPSRRRAPAHA